VNHTSFPQLTTSLEYNDELNGFLDISHAEIEATDTQQKQEILIAAEFVKIFKEDLKNTLNNALTKFQFLKIDSEDPRNIEYLQAQYQLITEGLTIFHNELIEIKNQFRFFTSLEDQDLLEAAKLIRKALSNTDAGLPNIIIQLLGKFSIEFNNQFSNEFSKFEQRLNKIKE
jgi:hypothetical protein